MNYAPSHVAFDSRTPMRIVDDAAYPSLSSSSRIEREGKSMLDALTKTARTFHGDPRANTSRHHVKEQNQDWLAEAMRHCRDVSTKTGLSKRAVENLRLKRNKISFDNLVELCRADKDFAAAFAEYVGLILPGEAEFTGAMNQAFSAYMRRHGGGGA
jgi:hypothetical protein